MTTEGKADDNKPQPIVTIKEAIIPVLKELGLTKLTINNDGCVDEGRLGDIEIEPESVSLPEQLEDQLRELIDAFLYQQHGAWGDGEGATGTVVLDTVENKITNEHGWYVSDVNYSTLEF
jgi:hypothetical protein